MKKKESIVPSDQEIERREINLNKDIDEFIALYSHKPPKNDDEYYQWFLDAVDFVLKGADEIWMPGLGKFLSIEEIKKAVLGYVKENLKKWREKNIKK